MKTMDEKEIRKILKEETVIPDNIDKAMEDVLKGILDSPDERMSSTKNLIVKSDKGRSKIQGIRKKNNPDSSSCGCCIRRQHRRTCNKNLDGFTKNWSSRGLQNRKLFKWLSQNPIQLQKMWKM